MVELNEGSENKGAAERLDIAVARRCGFSREYAKRVIAAGKVFVGGALKTKAGEKIAVEAEITVRDEGMKYVGRGGYKLEKALAAFGITLENKICIDIGASTGGFTDCMLQNGAAKVYAVDTGTAQLAEKLLSDNRVISMEKTKFQSVGREQIEETIDFIAADVSFVSLTKLMENIAFLLDEGGAAALLIKPQFEAGRAFIGKNGVVKDPRAHKRVIAGIYDSMVSCGLAPKGLDFSPIKGQEGNIEYLIFGVKGEGALPESTFRRLAEDVVAGAFTAMKKE